MSTKAKTETVLTDSAGEVRREPEGRAQRPAGTARLLEDQLPDEVRDRLSDEVIDELLAGARSEEEVVGPGGVLAQRTKRLVERALAAELTEHLAYEPHQEPPGGTGNTRTGSKAKTLATEHTPVRIGAPRDRKDSFGPQLVRKGSGASRASTTRSSRSTHAACLRARSRRTWPRSTGSRWAAT